MNDVCFPEDIARKKAVEELKDMEKLPYRKMFEEIIQTDLGSKLGTSEFGSTYDELRTKYGVDLDFMELLQKIGEHTYAMSGIFVCPCCKGEKIHIRFVREKGEAPYEESYDCSTCRGTGKLIS